ncbi:MAG: glycoside hydrolase family 2 [Clostridia bacterium]|nr:glycoside hydrolase family 2 [Clostridia bacterium]
MDLTKLFEGLPRADAPFSLYPRPQMVRDSYICLNGTWHLAIGKNDTGKAEPADDFYNITVPFPPQSALSGVNITVGQKDLLYYKRSFEKPQMKEGERLLLHFGAVDHGTAVFVNDACAGSHAGGYLPFSFDITPLLKDGENELRVVVQDETDPTYPYGKQKIKRGGMWYTPISGIWQTVFMECVPEKHIESIRALTTEKGIELTVFGGEEEKTLLLEGKEYPFKGEKLVLPAENFEYWCPEDPKLYQFTLKSGKDEVRSYFARRTVEIKDGDIFVNGKKYFFHGLLDQGYHPDGIFLPPSEEELAKDILRAKDLGFNMLRKHIKVEPQLFYYFCDVLGIFVFQDMVNSGKYSFFRDTALPTVGLKKLPDSGIFCHVNRQTRDFFIKHSKGILNALYNHPSVIYYTVFNEGWGQFDCDAVYEELKSVDPSRVFDATSGWFAGKKSDVTSLHVYFKKFKAPKRKGARPLILSEFGGYSLPVEGHRFNTEKNYGYSTYKDQKSFEEAFLALYEKEILPAIDKGLQGTVYTQIFDVEDETNGLYTYDRQICKVTGEKMKALSARLYEKVKE